MKRIFVAFVLLNGTTGYAAVVQNDSLSQVGGISEASPSSTSTQLNYRVCNSSSSDQQALLKINIIGNAGNQVPAGSTISSATLRLRAEVGGDGLMYRASEVWDASPTWNELGDTAVVDSSIGVGLNTGQSMEFDVTNHVQLWADGTSNQGWVIKGFLDDCSAARIYNGSASASNRPRLTVIFTPPDTMGPRIADIDVGSTISTHADHDVPDGSGEQIKTIPVAKVNQIIVRFDENVINVNASAFSIVSANTGTNYPLASGGVTYDSGTFTATFQLASPIDTADQLVLTIANSVTDAAGNALDGEWTNPVNANSTGTDTFPSGNGTPGTAVGGFKFNITILPGDWNVNNMVETGDDVIFNKNEGMSSGAAFTQGDGDGDGEVDSFDNVYWTTNYGVDFTTW